MTLSSHIVNLAFITYLEQEQQVFNQTFKAEDQEIILVEKVRACAICNHPHRIGWILSRLIATLYLLFS
jgi:hypothetical protein